jgi:hypothetical protein
MLSELFLWEFVLSELILKGVYVVWSLFMLPKLILEEHKLTQKLTLTT